MKLKSGVPVNPPGGSTGMSGLINIGFGNIVNGARIVAIISPDSAPIKRLIQTSRDEGRIIDATQGRRTRAVLIMDDNHIILSALMPDTISGRLESKNGLWAEKNSPKIILDGK